MTAKELNSNVLKLYKKVLNNSYSGNTQDWSAKDWENYNNFENSVKAELSRLFSIDKELEYFNLKSIKILLFLNQKYRAIPFHYIGMNIKL